MNKWSCTLGKNILKHNIIKYIKLLCRKVNKSVLKRLQVVISSSLKIIISRSLKTISWSHRVPKSRSHVMRSHIVNSHLIVSWSLNDDGHIKNLNSYGHTVKVQMLMILSQSHHVANYRMLYRRVYMSINQRNLSTSY